MRTATAVLTVIMTAFASAPAAIGSPLQANLDGQGPRARVDFIRTVSEPTPFADNCGSEGAAYEDAEVEPHLSVNPRNPNHLLATWQQDRYRGGGARSNLAAVSYNGGNSWQVSTLPGVSTCTGGERLKASDPWTAIGADGTGYVTSFAVTDPGAATDPGITDEFDGDTVINRSRSGGSTWDPPSFVAEDDGTFWHEKAVIRADTYDPDTLYAAWARHLMPDPTPLVATLNVAAAFSRSDDGGRTWTEPIELAPDLPYLNEWPNDVLILPTVGDDVPALVAVVRVESSRAGDVSCSLYATRSHDGGETWSAPALIAVPTLNGNIPPTGDYEEFEYIRAVPCATGSAVSADGTAYVVWFERTPVGEGPGGARIRFARSDDGGATWQVGVVAEVPSQAFLPSVAVAGDGTVGVTYFDTVNDDLGDDELTTDLRFASSADGGRTWDQIHLAGPFDLRTAPIAGGYMLGDYFGLVGLPDGFGALVALAEPIAETGPTDIFYVRIVTGAATRRCCSVTAWDAAHPRR